MTIEYKETTNDLLKRIDIHNKFGGRDIDEWMLGLLNIQKGANILDVGCGAGKQCFKYHAALSGDCSITGGDVSDELLSQAIKENEEHGSGINFTRLDFNQPFNFPDNTFDLESCCFAIYYAENIPATIKEMHRVLKTGGRLFTSGPMPENKKLFYDIIREATHNKPIPPMPGSSRYGSAILDAMKATFSKVEISIFENPLTFTEAQPFLDYTRASLSEDRKLWSSFFQDREDFDKIMQAIQQVAETRLAREGKLVMTKVVGGFVATK
jgi:ubiquinone/menaquinone biosynthesis C-methylase UbiE